MTKAKTERVKINLNVDLNLAIAGFGSARTPTAAHHKIVKHYASPFLFGPPVCDGLLELVMHMYTAEEAELVQYLPPFRARTAEKLARLSGQPLKTVQQIMHRLTQVKFVVLASGDPSRYSILPIVPGTFEMALITPHIPIKNIWHRKFAELFERLWDQGFLIDYISKRRQMIRYLPVGGVSKSLYRAWPSDKLEEVLEPYNRFAVGNCQCRMAMELVGKGCGRPLENCLSIGPMSLGAISRGLMRKVDKQEAIDIKRNAEESGCVTWMLNGFTDWRGNASCSCCGCCCHGLRIVTQFNTPGFISQPHFRPEKKDEKCTLCKKCIRACPMNAWIENENALDYDPVRCIGCGLCVVACKEDALEMRLDEKAKPPEDKLYRMMLQIVPEYIWFTGKEWVKRLLLTGR